MDIKKIRDLASEVLNASITTYIKTLLTQADNSINKKLKDYENSIFNNDDETQILLDNNIHYYDAIQLIDKTCVVNLRWLKSLTEDSDLKIMREEHYLKFPIEKVLLVEGLTLLPAFSKFLGHDFYQKGIQVIPAGGKSQVVKMYYRLSEELKLPIFLLLDKDAEDNIAQINYSRYSYIYDGLIVNKFTYYILLIIITTVYNKNTIFQNVTLKFGYYIYIIKMY